MKPCPRVSDQLSSRVCPARSDIRLHLAACRGIRRHFGVLPGEEVTGQSHAWVDYWTGEWVACDPTNDSYVGERHVVVAGGRDYADVPPLKGIYPNAVE